MREQFQRLKQRKIVQWAIAYLFAAWVALQVIEYLVGTFGLPVSVNQLATLVLALGLSIVLVLAWYHGEKGAQRIGGTELLLLTVLVVAGGGLISVLWDVEAGQDVEQELTLSDKASIAVLPFENLNAEPDDAYFSNGITDDIIAAISMIPDMRVIAYTTAITYKDSNRTVQAIGKELEVDIILTGTVRREGDRIRIVTNLVNARTNTILWTRTYDREIGDIFLVQSEIAGSVAAAIGAILAQPEGGRLAAASETDPQTYDLYLQGREMLFRDTDESVGRSIALFQRATDRDRGYALAWAGLGEAYATAFVRGIASPASLDSSKMAASRAIELDPELAEGHKALAMFWQMQSRWSQAIRQNYKAVELNPNYASAILNLGLSLTMLGRIDESIFWLERNLQLDPRPPRAGRARIYSSLGYAYMLIEEDSLAAHYLRMATEIESEHWPGWMNRSELAALHGNRVEALAWADSSKHPELIGQMLIRFGDLSAARKPLENWWSVRHEMFDPDDMLTWHVDVDLAYVLLQMGEEARASELLSEAERVSLARLEAEEEGGFPAYYLASVYALRGRRNDAIYWLGQLFDAGYLDNRWVQGDPLFTNLRGDSRFIRLMADVDRDKAEMRRLVKSRHRS